MPNPTSRVLQVLELLQSSGSRTLGELAELLAVDPRTVRRYIEHLRELEVPVESLRGRYGGYRIAPGYRLPPLMLTDDEAIAVLLGLVDVRSRPGSPASRTAAETAAAKVRRAIPKHLAARVAILLSSARWTSGDAQHDFPDAAVLLTVADAVHHRRELRMGYRSRTGERTDRTVRPYDLIEYRSRWYVLAWDIERAAERAFRIDHIVGARALASTFPLPAERDSEAALVSHFANADYEHRVELRIRATRDHILARVPASVAVIDDVPGEPSWQRATIRAVRLDWIAKILIDLDCPVVVEAPDELRDVIAGQAARLKDAIR